MADAQLTPSSNDPLAGAVASASSAELGIAKRERAEEDQLYKAAGEESQDIAGIEGRTAAGEARLQGEADKLTPPTFKPIPPPTVQPTDPKQIWGSAAMFIAAFGGLMTRQPMTAALNAAAGVINAYKKGDQEAANQAFQSWKVASDNAVKAAEFEQKTYDQALAGIDRRVNALDREGAAQVREAMARFTAAAAAAHNATALQVAESGVIGHVFNFVDDNARIVETLQVNGPKVEDEQIRHEIAVALEKDPKYEAMKAKGDYAGMYKMAKNAGVFGKDDDPMQNPRVTQALKKTFDNSVQGKANAVAQVANDELQGLLREPDILNNPEAQIGAIDRFIYLATGSVRPGIAQYQKILGAQTLKDYYAMKMNLIAHHPVLGPDQIANMRAPAQTEADAAKRAYYDYLAAPDNRDLAIQLGMLPDDYVPGQGTPHPASDLPQVGDVQDGYKYNGGDPSDQANWTKQ